MMPESVDCIIVGGGVMGCAAAYQLAKDGRSVILIEQYTVGNRKGSSHGSRLFRLAHASLDYVELARAALALWKELESESGEQIMHPVDGLDLGSPAILDKFRITLQEARVPFDLLDRDDINRRFPQFVLPEGTQGLLQDSYAMLDADRCVSVVATMARRHGATIIEHEVVRHILPDKDGVQVRTSQATYHAGSVIVCVGSWMKPLLRHLGLDLPLVVRNEVVTYYQPEDRSAWMPGRFPIFRHHLEGTEARWGVGFPIFGKWGVKMLLDCTGPIADPHDPDRTPDPGVIGRIRNYAANILPALGDTMVEISTCRYTLTPDDDFILDRHPEYEQIVIASPCSGHGFKFAPLIGRILADLAEDGRTEYNIERFRLDRPGLAN